MRLPRAFSAASVTILCFVAILAYALIQMSAVDRALRANEGENNLWASTQADRETLRLLVMLTDPDAPGVDAMAVRFRFDILYSRVALLADPPQSDYFISVGAGEAVRQAKQILDQLAARIDTPGFTPATGADLREDITDLSDLLREIANDTVLGERSKRSDRHDQQQIALRLLLFAVLGAFATGAFMAGQLLGHVRRSVRAQTEIARHRALLEDTVARRTAELQDALAVERRAKEIYRSFIITVSHQFRTPISIIHMVAQRQLRRPATDPAALGRKFARILDAAERLERLLAGIVATASVDSPEVTLNRRRIDLNTVVRAALRAIGDAHPTRVFDADLAPGPLEVEGDAVLLEQVVLNLLSNAAKYSAPPAPVTVTTTRQGTQVECRVRDTGIGIPETAQATIFERFFRAPNVHRLPGLGVGLSLSRDIVTLHGGGIGFVSREGEGSVFTVTLPAAGGPADEPRDADGDDPVHRG